MAVKTPDKYVAILHASEMVFAKHGYHGAQVSKIASEAGVAAGTVYLYFKNKPDILVSLLRDRVRQLVEEARRCFADADTPAEQLRRFILLHFHSLSARRDLAVVTQIELRQADSEVQHQISQIMRQYFQVIDEIIAKGQQTGLFRTTAEPKQMRNLVFGTLDQTVTAWVLSGFRFDLEAMAEPTFELLTGGLFSR